VRQVEVYASGLSLDQRSPTECGVSEYDSEASILRRLWPTVGCCIKVRKKKVPFSNFGRCIRMGVTPFESP
jgi:hypothetical protein